MKPPSSNAPDHKLAETGRLRRRWYRFAEIEMIILFWKLRPGKICMEDKCMERAIHEYKSDYDLLIILVRTAANTIRLPMPFTARLRG